MIEPLVTRRGKGEDLFPDSLTGGVGRLATTVSVGKRSGTLPPVVRQHSPRMTFAQSRTFAASLALTVCSST